MTKEFEGVVPNLPYVYKVYTLDDLGKEHPTGDYRVRKQFRTDTGRTMHVKTFKSFEEARDYRNALVNGLIKPVQKNEVCEKTTFQEMFEKFIHHKRNEMHLAESTIEQYQKLFAHLEFFYNQDIAKLTPAHIDSWCDLLNDPEYKKTQKSSRLTYEKEYTLLSGFLNYYREYHNQSFVNPLLKRHRKRLCTRPKTSETEILYLNNENQEKFFWELEMGNLKDSELYFDVARVQVLTGMRIGEVLALEKDAVSLEGNHLVVKQHLYWERKANAQTILKIGTKAGPNRTIPLSDECKEILKRRMSASPNGRIFEREGEWLTYRNVQNAYDSVFKSLGLPFSGTHVLRHTFAVNYLELTNGDFESLRQLLGHTDLKQTQRYARYSNLKVRNSFKVFNDGLQSDTQCDLDPAPAAPVSKSVSRKHLRLVTT